MENQDKQQAVNKQVQNQENSRQANLKQEFTPNKMMENFIKIEPLVGVADEVKPEIQEGIEADGQGERLAKSVTKNLKENLKENFLKKPILSQAELEAKILQTASVANLESKTDKVSTKDKNQKATQNISAYKDNIYAKYAKKQKANPQIIGKQAGKNSKLKGAGQFDYDSYFGDPKTKGKAMSNKISNNHNRIKRFGLTAAVLLVIFSAYVALDKVMGNFTPNLPATKTVSQDDAVLTVNDYIPKEVKKAGSPATVDVLPNQDGNLGKPKEVETKNSKTADSDYFVNYRLEREKVRSQQLELLNKMVATETTDAEVRKEAQQQILSISGCVESELLLESLLVAKYGGEAVVFVQPEQVNVVLKKNEAKMTDNEAEKIAQLVANHTGIGYENAIIVIKD